MKNMQAQPTGRTHMAATDGDEVARAKDLIHYHHTVRVVRDDTLAADDRRGERKRDEVWRQVSDDVFDCPSNHDCAASGRTTGLVSKGRTFARHRRRS